MNQLNENSEHFQRVKKLKHEAIQSIERAGTSVAYAASGGTVFAGLTVDEWGIVGVIVGIALGVATFIFNVWFKMKYQR